MCYGRLLTEGTYTSSWSPTFPPFPLSGNNHLLRTSPRAKRDWSLGRIFKRYHMPPAPPAAQSLGISFQWGRGSECTGYTSASTDHLEIFQMLLGNTQKVKLFICRMLFICFFEILNPGGPLIDMIFFFWLLCQRHKGFKLIHNKHLYFFQLNPLCCDPSARSGPQKLIRKLWEGPPWKSSSQSH